MHHQTFEEMKIDVRRSEKDNLYRYRTQIKK